MFQLSSFVYLIPVINSTSTSHWIVVMSRVEKKSESVQGFEPLTIITVNKPYGHTSMDVVRDLRRVLKPVKIRKVGYAGTLDPCATGVLIVGISRGGTKQMAGFTDQDKEYVTEIDLLKDTESGDMEKFSDDDQKALGDTEPPTLDEIKGLIETKFVGKITQTPPGLSAIKINGKKACDLVRSGQEVKMKSRDVTIHGIDILEYKFPVLKLRVKCSKGTYIRTLGQDIGKELGLWGTLVSLTRTVCGDHRIEDALELSKITLDDLRKK